MATGDKGGAVGRKPKYSKAQLTQMREVAKRYEADPFAKERAPSIN
jgi:hypothetical protein